MGDHTIDPKTVRTRRVRRGIVALILVLLFASLAGGVYCVYAKQFEGRFLEGTYINGIDAGHMTSAQVENAIRDSVESYSISLDLGDNRTAQIKGTDIGLSYQPDGQVETLLGRQNKYAWVNGKILGKTYEYTVDPNYSFDKDKLMAVLKALPAFNEGGYTAPTDAYMQMGDNNLLSVVPETEGNELNIDTVYAALVEAVTDGKSSFSVADVEDAYVEPQVRSDDQDLNNQVNDLNTYLSLVITTRKYDGSTLQLDGSIISSWLSVKDPDSHYYYFNTDVMQDFCRQYMTQVAEQDDQTSDTVIFHTTNKGDIEENCSTYGHTIDVEASAEQLYQTILSRTNAELTPVYSMNTTNDGTFGGTYVEVDIAAQHVYLYENGSLIFDTACVTGLASDPDRATPKGCFKIYMKDTSRTLKGAINPATGQPSYTSYVNYWMPFHNGVGLHDASWRSTFGGSIYQYSGSHGCVNLSYSAAQTIYNHVSVGTVVVVD